MINLEIDPSNGLVYLKAETQANIDFLKYCNLPVNFYELTLEELYGIFQNAIGETKETPILPYGCVYYSERKDYDFLLINYKEKEFLFNHIGYDKLTNLKMYFPECYFLFVLTKKNKDGEYSISKTFILVEKEKFLFQGVDFNSKKYSNSPFPNYSQTYGSGVCWGSSDSVNKKWTQNSPPLINLHEGIHRYISSDFNNDLSPIISAEELKKYIVNNGHLSFVEFFLKKVKADESYNLTYIFDNYSRVVIHYLFLNFYAINYNCYPPNYHMVLSECDKTISELISNPFY